MKSLGGTKYSRRVRRRLASMLRPTIKANIFFLHIPKCGGTSIGRAIGEHFPAHRSFSLPPETSARAAALARRDTLDFRRDLLLFAFAELRGGYIRGHFPFSLTAWTEFHEQWQFITILRHPVRRWLSSYFFSRFRSHNRRSTMITEDLEDFLETPRAASMGCAYVRTLSEGAVATATAYQAQIDEAIANLEKFDLVGTLEHLPDFTAQLQQTFRVRPAIGRRNESPLTRSRQRELVTPEIMSRAERLCEPDMQVYQHALRMNRMAASTS